MGVYTSNAEVLKAFYGPLNNKRLFSTISRTTFQFLRLLVNTWSCDMRRILNSDLLPRRPVRHWLSFPFSISCSPISVIPQTLRTRVSFIDLHIAPSPLKVVNQAPSSVADYFTSVFIHCLQKLSEIVL